jgi:hypothetical protein
MDIARSLEDAKRQRKLWRTVQLAAESYVDFCNRHGWAIRLRILEEPCDRQNDEGETG